MNHEVRFDEKQGILYVRFVEEVTPEEYREVSQQILSMPEAERRRILIDVSEASMPKWSREVRKALAESSTAPPNTRSAVVGISPALRVLSKAIILVAGKRAETRFFKTEQEAIDWLKVDAKQ
jgi:DNA-directed RNA polymerase subunit F